MKNELITHVFGAVQGLEKYSTQINSLLDANKNKANLLTSNPEEHNKVIKHMRRIANKLQLEVAKNNTSESYRLLKLFYGLNSLVRPEVLSTFVILSRKNTKRIHRVDQVASLH